MFAETNQAIIALPQPSEEGKTVGTNTSLTKFFFFLEKLRNEMSIDSFEKLQQIPGDREVTQISRPLHTQERPRLSCLANGGLSSSQ